MTRRPPSTCCCLRGTPKLPRACLSAKSAIFSLRRRRHRLRSLSRVTECLPLIRYHRHAPHIPFPKTDFLLRDWTSRFCAAVAGTADDSQSTSRVARLSKCTKHRAHLSSTSTLRGRMHGREKDALIIFFLEHLILPAKRATPRFRSPLRGLLPWSVGMKMIKITKNIWMENRQRLAKSREPATLTFRSRRDRRTASKTNSWSVRTAPPIRGRFPLPRAVFRRSLLACLTGHGMGMEST